MSTADQRLGSSRHPVGMFQDRPAYDAPEKPGGEGWIANRGLEQLCQFRLAPAVSTCSQDEQADASTERDSRLADDAQDGVGALSTACEVSGEHSEQTHQSNDQRLA